MIAPASETDTVARLMQSLVSFGDLVDRRTYVAVGPSRDYRAGKRVRRASA